MRSKHKSWQNARHGWTRRIIWYEEKGKSIRLHLEEADYGTHNIFFAYDENHIAQGIYDLFKDGKTIPEIKLLL